MLSDEYKGYLKDDETAAANHIYQKDGAKDGQAEIAIAGNLTLTEEGYTLGKYDETGDLSQMLSEQILSAMTGADALFLNQEFSISRKDFDPACQCRTYEYIGSIGSRCCVSWK